MRLAAVALALALALTGCGSSRRSSSTGTAQRAITPIAASTGAIPTATRAHSSKPAAHGRTRSTTTASAAAPAALQPTPAASGPDGLRVPSGYATAYDNCQGSCNGAVPDSLRRPLRLSSARCSLSESHGIAGMSALGNGPVGPVQAASLTGSSFVSSAWSGARVTWIAAASYSGPVLIRGRELGGGQAVGFGEGNVPVDELQLNDSAASGPGGAREWPSFTRVRGPGCYAYQVDGTSFSSVIVFRMR